MKSSISTGKIVNGKKTRYTYVGNGVKEQHIIKNGTETIIVKQYGPAGERCLVHEKKL